MSDTTLSPRLRHLLIHEDRNTGDLYTTPPALVASYRDDSPPNSPEPSYQPLAQKVLRSADITTHIPDDLGHRPSHSIFSLLNSLVVESPPSSPGLVSPRDDSDLLPTVPLQRIPPPLMSAPLPTSGHSPWYTREHRPSVDVPSASAPRPDMYRRHSSHPYEINPATNRIVYREFDFAPSGSRAPISRTTKACNACRSRKVRCDAGGETGAEPATCSRCKEAGLECAYSGAQKKRGPCPGTARPGITSRRSSQRITMSPPPELSPTLTSRSSHGLLPYEADPYYLPPRTPNDPNAFPSFPQYQPPPPPGSGWTSSHPRPLAPATSTRRPTTGHSSHHSRQPSIVSWHPSDIPEERSQMFEKEYSMQALADEGSVRVAEDEWRGEQFNFYDQPRLPEAGSKQSSTLQVSSFGGDGRSLPPLRVVLGGGTNYFEPRESRGN